MRIFVLLALMAPFALSGCMPEAGIGALLRPAADPTVQVAAADAAQGARTGAPLSALSQEAATPQIAPTGAAPSGPLGRAQASLGNPRDPGLWVLTQYVSSPTPGTVTVSATGRSAQVELRPSGGAAARLSLAAMQALGLPLTALQEVEIYGAEPVSGGG